MSLERYYIPPPVGNGPVTLAGPEAHHLLHVMRAGPGDEVLLFDGQGRQWRACVLRVSRREAELALVEAWPETPAERVPLALGIALPKGERQRWLVEKAVELGVDACVPLTTARGVAQPVPQAIERLRRAAIEAAKQCGRSRLMEIAPPRSWSEFLARPADELRLIAQPGGAPLASLLEAAKSAAGIAIAIGPEGGFTDEEVSAAQTAGWRQASLGSWTLRVETAVAASAAVVAQWRMSCSPPPRAGE